MATLLALALPTLVLLLLLLRPRGRDVRVVSLSVGEELALDPAGHHRLRLVAVAADSGGRPALFLETLPLANSTMPVRLTSLGPLPVLDRELRLLDVRPDPARGAAVQLLWIPRDSAGSRVLLSLEEEPVPLPIDSLSIEIRVVGPTPPPGGREALELDLIGLPGGTVRKQLARGGRVSIGDLGELGWIGTRERLLARIEIR